MISRSGESSNFWGSLHTVLHSDIIHSEILENMPPKIKNKTRMHTICHLFNILLVLVGINHEFWIEKVFFKVSIHGEQKFFIEVL